MDPEDVVALVIGGSLILFLIGGLTFLIISTNRSHRCRRCRKLLTPLYKFCPGCGAQDPLRQECRNCGSKANPRSSKFCVDCGAAGPMMEGTELENRNVQASTAAGQVEVDDFASSAPPGYTGPLSDDLTLEGGYKGSEIEREGLLKSG